MSLVWVQKMFKAASTVRVRELVATGCGVRQGSDLPSKLG